METGQCRGLVNWSFLVARAVSMDMLYLARECCHPRLLTLPCGVKDLCGVHASLKTRRGGTRNTPQHSCFLASPSLAAYKPSRATRGRGLVERMSFFHSGKCDASGASPANPLSKIHKMKCFCDTQSLVPFVNVYWMFVNSFLAYIVIC